MLLCSSGETLGQGAGQRFPAAAVSDRCLRHLIRDTLVQRIERPLEKTRTRFQRNPTAGRYCQPQLLSSSRRFGKTAPDALIQLPERVAFARQARCNVRSDSPNQAATSRAG